MSQTRNSRLFGKITVFFVICFFVLPAQAKYGGGTGEPNDPYLIFDANQMNAIGADANDWDKHFLLCADIDLSGFTGTSFNIIGNFTGVFDGNGHTISNFTYTSTGTKGIGLFGLVFGSNAEIKNLGLIDPNVSAGEVVGSLVGCLMFGTVTNCYAEGGNISGDYAVGGLVGGNGGTISNCHSSASVSGEYGVGGLVGRNDVGLNDVCKITNCYSTGSISGISYIGGLVGLNYVSKITNCYSTGSISGVSYIGGLVGYNIAAEITNCYSTGGVSGEDDVGGLVGHNNSDLRTITNCYSTGSVFGNDDVGGLVGYNYGTITDCYSSGSVTGDSSVGGLVGSNFRGKITNCYSTGRVSGTYNVGGLVGYNEKGEVTASFWDIETSRQITSAGGTGKTTAEMKMQVTFMDAGWNFENIWWILEGAGYPGLCWEEKYGGGSGEPNDPYLIYTAEQMNTIGACQRDWDKCFKLMADIDLSVYTGTTYNIIGNGGNPFTGVFDGNGYTISYFTHTSSGKRYIGLFGYVEGSNAEVKNLGLIDPNVDAGYYSVWVGTLVGYLEEGTISGCFVKGGGIIGNDYVGGLVGSNHLGTIINCRSDCSIVGISVAGGLTGHNGGTISNCDSSSDVWGFYPVGGLTGFSKDGTINNCCATGSATGDICVGGLVGYIWRTRDTITNSFATGNVVGRWQVGGLLGFNDGIITNCYSSGSVTGDEEVGGLVGSGYGTIIDSYSIGSVSGSDGVGGLEGRNWYGTITNCYSAGSVAGYTDVGGLVGYRLECEVTNSFWDIETSGQATSDGGTGLPTAEMQMASTFTDAGWDFNTPVWTIDDGVDYPHLWWEFVPVLHAEPELTLGTSNTISWEPVVGGVEYYAECGEDANFTSIIYNSGWIMETSFEFNGLQVGQQYWYSVKARNAFGTETDWSNVESSLQCSLSDAVEATLEPESLKNENMKNALLNKIDAALKMIEEGNYTGALSKLRNDILTKTNGCAEMGQPDKNDWIITCEQQSQVYPLVIETIDHVKGLME